MEYDLTREHDFYIFDQQIKWLRENKAKCKVERITDKISVSQNAALHKYYEMISHALNEKGITYTVKIVKEIEHPFTPMAVKEHIIRPIMISMFNKKSTTDLTTQDIDKIIDTITNWLSGLGIEVHFPSIKNMIYENK